LLLVLSHGAVRTAPEALRRLGVGLVAGFFRRFVGGRFGLGVYFRFGRGLRLGRRFSLSLLGRRRRRLGLRRLPAGLGGFGLSVRRLSRLRGGGLALLGSGFGLDRVDLLGR